MTTPREHLVNVVIDELHDLYKVAIIDAWNDMCDQAGKLIVEDSTALDQLNEVAYD